MRRPGRLTLNGIEGALLVVRGQVFDPLAHDERQLDLIMQVDALGPDDRALAGLEHTGWWLEEEEGLFRPSAVELLDMVPVGRGCERASSIRGGRCEDRTHA